jgi:hypothetical protein
LLPDAELDAFEVAFTEEPMLPVALALALPPPEADVYVVTLVEEPPLALALLETLDDWAIASPALNTRPSNRQGDTKFFKTFIDTSHGIELALCQLFYAWAPNGVDDSRL